MKVITHTREEILELCRRDPEAVVDLIELLAATIDKLDGRVGYLEQQLDQNSSNSHKPPSSDGFKRTTKSIRPKSNRSSGAQDGHKGTTLKMSKSVDHTIQHKVSVCNGCGHSLRAVKPKTLQRRQVFDIPKPRIEVTEHQCEVKECPHCGTTTTATFPSEVTKAVQYGTNIKSIATYLMQYQLLPSERTKVALQDLFGCCLAEGTLFRWAEQLHTTLETPEQTVKEQLLQAPVVHSDETGLFCKQKLHWLHVVSTERLTHYQVHPKRGTVAMDAIGVLPAYGGRVIHDMWKPYFSYDCAHGVCNAHILRELTYAYEEDHQRWAGKLKRLLLHIHHTAEGARQREQTSLSVRALRRLEHRYDRLVATALRSNPRQCRSPNQRGRKKQTKTRNLAERLHRYRPEVLAFMYDFRVPFTNNQAERDIRMMKVKQKISGTFRSLYGAEIFCRIRGYLSTARKNAVPAFDALVNAFTGNPFVPTLNYAE